MCYTLDMRRLLALLAFPLLSADLPYRMTQGNVTLVILDWANRPPVPVPTAPGPYVRGIMLTACTSDGATDELHITTTYVVNGSPQSRTDRLTRLVPMGGFHGCETTILKIARSDIRSISIQERGLRSTAAFDLIEQ